MKWLNRISSLFIIGLSLLILYSSLQLGIGGLHKPGPGFLPFLASVLVLALSLVVLIGGMIERAKDEGKKKPFVPWRTLVKMIGMVLGLALYILLFKRLGYVITALLLMFIMFFIYEPKKWYKHIIVAGLVSGISFVIFRSLGVQLPSGIFRVGW